MSDQKSKDTHDNFMASILKIGWFFVGFTVSAFIFYILDQIPTVADFTFTYFVVVVIAVADWVGKTKGGDSQ